MRVDLVVINAGELLTLSGPSGPRVRDDMRNLGIIRDGAVAIRDGRIALVGETREVLGKVSGGYRVIDAEGRVVAPGFIDPHVHLVFNDTREDELEKMIMGYTYLELKSSGGGMPRTIRLTREASTGRLIKRCIEILNRMLIHGTTTIEAKSGYEMTLEGEIRQLEVINILNEIHPIEIKPTFCAQAIPPEWEGREWEYTRRISDEWLPEIARRGLADFVDVFCEEGFFTVEQSRVILGKARELGFKLKIHADWLKNSGGGTLAEELGVVSADHLIFTPLNVINRLAETGAIGVLLPTTPFCYLGRYADARKLIESGLPIALGTDLSAINMCESMQMMMTIACLQMKMLPSEAYTASTINAAYSIGLGGEIGSIEVGKQGDLIILDMPSYRHIPFHYGVNLVDTVIKRGRVVVEEGDMLFMERLDMYNP